MPGAVTTLLSRLRGGDQSALDELVPLVYDHLHRIAQGCMRTERPGHTIQATSLVNEAWLRLSGTQASSIQDRAHFYGICARLMRQILVDHARARAATKRGSGAVGQMPEHLEVSIDPIINADILTINAALDKLADENESRARLIEMRFFSGMNLEEIAEVTGVSLSTVHRELRVTQAWLLREVSGG
jgi:RNA polymerase sigma factor (TIGR02999 family)